MSKLTTSSNGNLIVEDAQIIFRNFEGKEKDFNALGDRNFCVVFSPEQGEELKAQGWNVKTFKPRPEDEEPPNTYVEVAVEYRKGRPPRAVMVNSQGRIDLGADEIKMFDWVNIAKCDLIINPYNWNVNGNSGKKAYLKSIFITIDEDELEQMYANVPDANARPEPEPADFYNE